jgi:hypothetical protein
MTRTSLALALLACSGALACGGGGGTASLQVANRTLPTGATLRAGDGLAAAAASVTEPTVFGVKLVAAYLARDVDPVTQNNIGMTEMIYLNPQCGEDISHCDIMAGPAPDGGSITHIVTDYFDFARATSEVNLALNAQERTIQEGTFRYLRLEFCKNGTGTPNVEWSTPETGLVQVQGQGCVVNAAIDPPVVVVKGDSITITVAYDLANSIQTNADPRPGTGSRSCVASGADQICFTVPTFVPSAGR